VVGSSPIDNVPCQAPHLPEHLPLARLGTSLVLDSSLQLTCTWSLFFSSAMQNTKKRPPFPFANIMRGQTIHALEATAIWTAQPLNLAMTPLLSSFCVPQQRTGQVFPPSFQSPLALPFPLLTLRDPRSGPRASYSDICSVELVPIAPPPRALPQCQINAG
jgi:hypothetical protein